ncbi:hypothetical protein KJS94_17985 [Flavihumibacter rivuli]|uniref:hypothetical protein n=1 Tax=Flavihumibacter rivuli TaxID=2838156 RepID=UPI001BDE3AA7|nr:hypothetical protein [Flavihumibacter rivuli]ULQ56545.1 hypothetical protein KJS94_17985 [Flavihumibacter rivuli]
MEMAKALLNKDYKNFARYMHPKLIKAAGGEQTLMQRMDSTNQLARQLGAEIKKILIGNPEKIHLYNQQLQCILPQTITLSSPMGTIELETSLIAISDDKGNNWHFLDALLYQSKELKESMPVLGEGLKIPLMKPPKFTPAASGQQ